MTGQHRAVERACAGWASAQLTEPLSFSPRCRSGIVLPDTPADARFCFMSVGSPLEAVLGERDSVVGDEILDVGGAPISVAELADRLLSGEVTAVVAPRGPVAATPAVELVLPDELIERRRSIRRDVVRARFLLRQIGLEEVSSHRGAHPGLYEATASVWSNDLALCIDPAMMLTLGADRQRYVDPDYNSRATDRLPRALGRLHDVGVRSHARLVIV